MTIVIEVNGSADWTPVAVACQAAKSESAVEIRATPVGPSAAAPSDLGRWCLEQFSPALAARIALPPTHFAVRVSRAELSSWRARPSVTATLLGHTTWEPVLPAAIPVSPACPVLTDLPLRPQRPLDLPTGVDAQLDDLPMFAHADRLAVLALQAGIRLWHGQLDASHALSQQLEGRGNPRDGDYWHAIMHRLEGDFGNAQYWFRRVGRHPVLEELPAAIAAWETPLAGLASVAAPCQTGRSWDGAAFVNVVQQAQREVDSPLEIAARALQRLEMLLLLRHCA